MSNGVMYFIPRRSLKLHRNKTGVCMSFCALIISRKKYPQNKCNNVRHFGENECKPVTL